jgi:site-specific DNA recombinase
MSHHSVASGRSNGSADVGADRAIDREDLGRKRPTTIRSDADFRAGRHLPVRGDDSGGLDDSAVGEPAPAIGYVRVSTDQQAEEGLSLEAQTDRVRAMAVVRGVALADVIVEADSAKSLRRPGMARLLALVDGGAIDTVLIAKLDRLTRSVVDLGALLARFTRHGVALVSVAESLDTASAAGRLVLHIMASVSQWEREAIAERTRDALAHKRSKGERVGTLPLGFSLAEDGVHVAPDPREQALLVRLRMAKAEGRSTRQIAADLNAAGVTTRRGTAWRFQYVARALRRTG